jgi:hypothetical protein
MITPRAIPAFAPVERPEGKAEELGGSEELAAAPKPLRLDQAEVLDGAIDDMWCKRCAKDSYKSGGLVCQVSL